MQAILRSVGKPAVQQSHGCQGLIGVSQISKQSSKYCTPLRLPMSQTSKKDFNFGATTDDETMVCGSARPGAKQQRCYADDLRVPAEEVAEWVEFMKGSAGVQRVVSLLTDSEVKTYAEPLPAAMEAAFGADSYINVDTHTPGGPAAVITALKDAKAKGQKVLVHCWGGGGRTGLVQAAWLVIDKGLSPEAAAAAVLEHSQQQGLSRRVDVAALKEFVAAAT